ncbi:MAG: xylulokinase [Sphingomonas sp.]|uniref:xylulokinase n=1 Tax=Sphingomonas sp. TaxID=28214 RepID=UPI001ACABDEC|nr:xylulokinase [Sphingomonas sp.]MBN8807852.1 xylulokinase [Sphingomonas sp.]
MFLGIDIGTSGVKAVVIDERGSVVDQRTAALTVQRPHPLWSEQDPDAWWNATDAAVRAIAPEVRRTVRGIGLAGQMHGATLLGGDDRPLRPAILWNDGRSFAECEELERDCPDLHAITGNLAMPGFTAPKLLWVRKHEPDIFAQVRSVLLPKDYVRLRMTGDRASDMADSAGTLWLDVAGRRWSDTVLAACGLSDAQMPRLFEGSQATGTLRPEIAEAWGMDRVPVAAGGGDNAAGAVGVGVVRDGDALLSLGTSGVIFVATAEFRPNPGRAVHAFCHCLPDLWHQMSVHLSAAACVDWVARLTGANGAAEMFERAERSGIGRGPELFLPYLSGERTPHNDPLVRGAFLQLDNDSDADRLSAAVLEGVAFALADGLDTLTDAGTTVDRLAVIGGGARSGHWGRILAAALERPLVYLQGGEVGPALGAARLAQLAVDGGDPAAVCAAPPVARIVEPEPALIDILSTKKRQFRDAYARITPRQKAA